MNQTSNNLWAMKMLISMIIDGIDLILGVVLEGILGAGTVIGGVGGVGSGAIHDIINTAASFVLWGPAGLIQGWEIVCPFDTADAFIPTVTIIGWMCRPKGEERGKP